MLNVAFPILLVGVMPFVLTGLSKSGGFSVRDNEQTRAWQTQLTGWRQRAYWAHANGFEAFPMFAAMVILAHLGRPGSGTAALAAWSFVGLRVIYSACYIANLGRLRSVVWMAGQVAVLVLFLVSISVLA